MALHDAYGAQWRQHVAAIDIMNELRWRVGDTVATGLLKINPDFFCTKTPRNPDKETKFKPPNTSKIRA